MNPCYQPSDLYTLIKTRPDFLKNLTPLQKLILRYRLRVRPDQAIPSHAWRFCGFICGRGWGKSWDIARELNRRVRAGMVRNIALVGPTEDRTREVCVKFLIDLSPPWFKAVEDKGGVLWPNGARAYVYTAEVEDIRGPNFDHAWLTEIAFWPASTRKGCFNNVTTATREGARQVFWDTTSKGKNELVLRLLAMHKKNPELNPILRGTIFDNEWYDRTYLVTEWSKYAPGRTRDEEMLGMVFEEAQGALWEQAWINDHRRNGLPGRADTRLVSIDPATTDGKDADLFGFVVGASIGDDVYILKDKSEKYKPEVWGAMVVDEYEQGAAGVVIEVTGNSGGANNLMYVIRTVAKERGYEVREHSDEDKPFPERTDGVIYVKLATARDNKETRAYPAAVLTYQGRVHFVGTLEDLEREFTTWVPGDRKSPNRLDAAARLITELSGIEREKPAVSGEQATRDAHAATKLINAQLARHAASRKVW